MFGVVGVSLCFVEFLYGPADGFIVHVLEDGRDQFAGGLVGFANGAAAVFAVDGVFRGKRLVDVAGDRFPGLPLCFGIARIRMPCRILFPRFISFHRGDGVIVQVVVCAAHALILRNIHTHDLRKEIVIHLHDLHRFIRILNRLLY